MLLTPQDVKLLFELHRALMFFVNQRLKVLPVDVASPGELSSLPPQVRSRFGTPSLPIPTDPSICR